MTDQFNIAENLSPETFWFREREKFRISRPDFMSAVDVTVRYMCYHYQPLDTDFAIPRIQRLKQSNDEDKAIIRRMILRSLDKFEGGWHWTESDGSWTPQYLENFDLIIQAPSSKSCVDLMADEFAERMIERGPTVDPVKKIALGLVLKNRWCDVKIDKHVLLSEDSDRTYEKVCGHMEHFATNKSIFQAKDLKASLRRYFYNFFHVSETHSHYSALLKANRILIFDDSIAELLTLRGMIHAIRQHNANANISCLCLARDYPSLSNDVTVSKEMKRWLYKNDHPKWKKRIESEARTKYRHLLAA